MDGKGSESRYHSASLLTPTPNDNVEPPAMIVPPAIQERRTGSSERVGRPRERYGRLLAP